MKNRAERRHQAKRVINKRLKIVKNMRDTIRINPDGSTSPKDGKTWAEKLSKQKNRMKKKHPLDCGNPKCGVCHPHKITGEKKISDLRKITGLENQFIDLDELEKGIK